MKNLLTFSFAVATVFAFSNDARALNGYNNGNNNCSSNHQHHNGCHNGNGGNNGGGWNGGGWNGGGNNGCNVNLSCDAGGPYKIDAAPGTVSVQLDGTDSFGATGWLWTTNAPGAAFNDATLPNPTLTFVAADSCSASYQITLTVTRNQQSKTCSTTVKLKDREKPVIQCPELEKVFSGMDTSPSALGFATATDNCDQNVKITYWDKIVFPDCKADRFAYVIERTWKAVDDDCNVSKCVQIIDVVRVVTALDVRPGVCPNVYDANACTLLPIAITGSATFDVTKINWCTVKVWGLDCTAGPIEPHSFHLADVATPLISGVNCNCDDLNGDGTLDLLLKVKRSKINQAFDVCDQPAGTTLPVLVTGRLCNGVYFIAQDCMVLP